MAFSVTWGSAFEAQPAGADNPTQGDDRIRELKTAVRQRLDQEHVFGTSDAANQGVHAQGAALVYYQDAEPTQLPDGETSLGNNTRSQGRLWIDTNDSNRFYHYTGTTWSSAWAMGSLTLSGAVAVGTSLSVGTTLSVTGVTTLSGLLNANAGIAVDTNKFTVADGSGNTAIDGTLTVGGTAAITGVATFTAQPIMSSLTASRAVFTDGSKGLVSNAITGTGNVVMSAGPTLTGTISCASITASGTVTVATADINGGNIDGTTIGGASAGAGSFTTLNASGDAAFDTDTLFVDVSEDRVGINDSTPSCELDISGTLRVSGGHQLTNILSWSSGTTEDTVYDAIAAAVTNSGDGYRYIANGNFGSSAITYIRFYTSSVGLFWGLSMKEVRDGEATSMGSAGSLYL